MTNQRNVENIIALADFIETRLTDDSFEYSTYFDVVDEDNHPVDSLGWTSLAKIMEHPCGTQGCIAGWACNLRQWENGHNLVESTLSRPAEQIAADWLGITMIEAAILFHGRWSPRGYNAGRLAVTKYLRDIVASGQPILVTNIVISEDEDFDLEDGND